MKSLQAFVLFSVVIFFFACKKEKTEVTGNVDFYLLQSFESSGYGQIDESTIVLETEVLIPYDEIEWYDDKNYRFEISENIKDELLNRDSIIDYRAFAVMADDALIYTGFFWPVYSSMICNWVVIDPVHIDINNQLEVKIGYPGTPDDVVIPDNRNDQLILDIFERDGKLK